MSKTSPHSVMRISSRTYRHENDEHWFNAGHRRAQEPRRQFGECLGVAGGLEHPGGRRRVMRTQQVRLGEHPQHFLGGLFRAGDQRDVVTHRQLDQSRQQRIVRAPQHQRVDLGALQRLQVALGQSEHLPTAGDAALDEVDEARACHRGDLGVAGGGERVLVGVRGDGRPRADHPDAAVAGGRDGAAHGRQDHLDDGHVVAFARVAQACRGRRVAGDHQHLDAAVRPGRRRWPARARGSPGW